MPDDRFQPARFDAPVPDFTSNLTWQKQRLPSWLARRLLRPDEYLTWVRGPRFNPWWERAVTHPGLFVLALLLAAGCVAVGRLSVESWARMPLLPALVAIGLVVGSIYVLAIANAYFTRLVVTNFRLVVMQGYEICRVWSIDALPPSLVRYRVSRSGERSRTVDLEALQTMLGSSSDQFTDQKTIRALSKQLDRMNPPEEKRR